MRVFPGGGDGAGGPVLPLQQTGLDDGGGGPGGEVSVGSGDPHAPGGALAGGERGGRPGAEELGGAVEGDGLGGGGAGGEAAGDLDLGARLRPARRGAGALPGQGGCGAGAAEHVGARAVVVDAQALRGGQGADRVRRGRGRGIEKGGGVGADGHVCGHVGGHGVFRVVVEPFHRRRGAIIDDRLPWAGSAGSSRPCLGRATAAPEMRPRGLARGRASCGRTSRTRPGSVNVPSTCIPSVRDFDGRFPEA